MATFFMFGKYSSEAMKSISEDRTNNAVDLIKNRGGELKSIYALLGEHDLVFIVELPGIQEAMKVSIELNKLTGISFTTSPAVDVREFDKLAAG